MSTWSTHETIEKLGLLDATGGVYISTGATKTEKNHYLLHSGAEPVLLSVPEPKRHNSPSKAISGFFNFPYTKRIPKNLWLELDGTGR